MNNQPFPQMPMSSDPEVIKNWSDDLVNYLMPKILLRLEAILPDYLAEQVLRHIDYPMDFYQAAYVLNVKEDTLRKWNNRGIVSFTKKGGRYFITLKQLCKQIGHSEVLQRIRDHH